MNLALPRQYEFVPRFLRLAVANILSNIMVPLANLISVIFLGHLPEIEQLAGVALAGNILNFLYLILSFLRMATTGVTAQAVGRKDREGVLIVGMRNSLIALIFGVVLILLRYPIGELGFSLLGITPEVKAAGIAYINTQIWAAPAILINFVLIGWFLGQEKNTFVVILSVIVSLVKIGLDYLLIVKLGWQSAGAGISYALSQYLALAISLVLASQLIKWSEVKESAKKVWEISALKSTLTLNSNIFISNLLILLCFFLFNYQSAQLGTIIYSENALLLQICLFCGYFVEGLGFGTEAIVGNYKGEGNNKQLVPVAQVSLGASLLLGLFFGGVCLLYPDTVFGLLTNHKEITENIGVYLPWMMAFLVFNSIAWMLDGYFLGLAEGHTIRNVSIGAVILGFAPVAFAGTKYSSNELLWLSLTLLYGIRFLALSINLPRTFNDDSVLVGGHHAPALQESASTPVAIENQVQPLAEPLEVSLVDVPKNPEK